MESAYTCARGGSAGAEPVGGAGGAVAGTVAVGTGEAPGLAAEVGPVESPGLDERNASHLPFGLQRGELDACGLVVNCHGGRLPSVAAIQIEVGRRLLARSIFVTTYATNFPSGEICGSDTN
jgi:hypothetical protein